MENSTKQSLGRVLLADDDELFRRGLGMRLTRAGFECEEAESGVTAAAKLQASTFDLLLSDINMPGNVNLELVKDVPVVAAGLPVVLLTGHPTVETAARSVRLKVVAYLIKPPDFEELCNVLKSAITDYRSVRFLRDNRRRLQDWDKEIERMLALFEQSGGDESAATKQSFVRLTLRNLVVSLVELEHLLAVEGKTAGAGDVVDKQELLRVVRKTIGVLAETRNQFKSKALGELRKELESVVGGRDS